MEVRITRQEAEQHLVFGWANVSVNKDGDIPLDTDNDIIPIEVLEMAAYNFVLQFRDTGEMHREGSYVGKLVESVVFSKEKMKSMGLPEGLVNEGWWVGFYIPDEEVCNKIKNGTYRMFSIQGLYRKVSL